MTSVILTRFQMDDEDTETEMPLSQGEHELISELQPGMSQEFKYLLEDDVPDGDVFANIRNQEFLVKQEVKSPVMITPGLNYSTAPQNLAITSYTQVSNEDVTSEPERKKQKFTSNQEQNYTQVRPANSSNTYNQLVMASYTNRTLQTPMSTVYDSYVAAHPKVPDLGTIPKTGKYNFGIEFEDTLKPPTKSCAFTYSKLLKKLFVRHGCPVPIHFHTKIDLPVKDTKIRAFLKYKEESQKHDVVQKCPWHLMQDEGNTHSEHLLQVVRGDTVYEKCDLTGHYVVSFRPDSGKLRCNNFWENFKLTCSTSCKGGINRRSAVLYFLLYVKDQVQGHDAVDIRISSSPGRDRKTAESKMQASTSAESMCDDANLAPPQQRVQQSKTNKEMIEKPCSSSLHARQKPKGKLLTIFDDVGEDDENYYRIKLPLVKGLANAQCLLHMASLMATSGEISVAKGPHAEQGSSSRQKEEKFATIKTEELRSTSSVITNQIKRSLSDPLHYGRQYKEVTVEANINFQNKI